MSNEKLPSGRILDANGDYWGISDDLSVAEGYDNQRENASFDEESLGVVEWNEIEDIWSMEDRIALADIMIKRWTRYRNKAVSELLD